MNLHQIVRGAIGAVNPDVLARVFISTGSTTAPDGKRVPAYAPPQTDVPMQVQPLTGKDIRHIDALNIQGVDRAIYVNGAVRGVQRKDGTGGDMLYVLNAYWLVVVMLEPWDGAGWTKVGVTQQLTGPS